MLIKRRASAYLYDGNCYICSYTTYGGPPRVAEPFFKVDADDASAAGMYLVEALEGSVLDRPIPEDWRESVKPLHKMAGTKTWVSFTKKAKMVHLLEVEPGLVRLVPTRNNHKGGFSFIEEKSRSTRLEARSIGESLLLALKYCEA